MGVPEQSATALGSSRMASADYDPRGSMNLRTLRVLTIVLPMGFVVALEVVRQIAVDQDAQGRALDVVLMVIMLLGIVAFSAMVFRIVGRTQLLLSGRNRELAAANAVSSAVRGALSLDDLLDAALDSVLIATGAAEATIVRFARDSRWPGESRTFRRRTAHPSLAGRSDAPSDVREIPLTTGATTVGTLRLAFPPEADPRDELASDTLATIGQQLAGAIQAAELFADLKRGMLEGHGFYDVLLQISNQNPLPDTLAAIVHHARTLLSAEDAVLTLSAATVSSLEGGRELASATPLGDGSVCITPDPDHLESAHGSSLVCPVRSGPLVLQSVTALAATVAALSLITALVTSDFSMKYVAEYTSLSLAVPYRIAAMWAGQGGSLLLWTWVSSLLAVIIVVQNHRKNWGVAPYAVTTFAVVTGLFAALVTVVESPFAKLAEAVADGQGLNPLLQDPLQIIHPLALYGGYILYTVPFALTISALVAGPATGPWIKVAQRWSALSWIALTIGIVLGARWAYAELGWGGYWGWDPVENASLLPWLTGTALLHSGVTHWRTGRLRLAGFVLVVTTFVLCLFGTFLTRSGVISSVHAFGESGLGPILGAAIFAIMLASGALIVWRLPALRAPKADGRSHGWFGQRLLLILLVAITVAVLWGTMYPLFLRVLRDQEIAVTPEFFRVVVTPMGIAILAIFALSPLLPDQSVGSRSRTAAVRGALAAVLFVGFWALSGWQNPGVALVLSLCVLALVTVVRKATPRLKAAWTETGDGRFLATLRSSGPYIAHVGLVVLLAAVTLNASLQQEGRVTLNVGKSATAGGQTVRLASLRADQLSDRTSFIAVVDVLGTDGNTIAVINTRQDQFTADGQTHAEVGIAAGLRSDIYVVLEAADTSTNVATVTVFTNPAVMWIWGGGLIMVIGGMLFMLPRRRGAPAMPTDDINDRSHELVGV